MPMVLSAGEPIEPLRCAVGRSSTLLVDPDRDDRVLGVDCWYPALGGDRPRSVYELLPGVGFTASALADPEPAPGPHPLLVFSHGRSGTRSSYAMLCEGLAARGYVVVAPDHPGDTLTDWFLGTAVDDTTNEVQRAGDVRFVLDAALDSQDGLEALGTVDATRVALAGHSYGAHTAFAVAGSEPMDPRIGAVAGLQSFTRTMSRRVLRGVTVPSLLIAGARDATCPPPTDATPAQAALEHSEARRIDIEHAGHQACSDVGLYLELAPQAEGLPDLVVDYLQTLADQVTGTAGDPWRPTVGLHLRLLGAWLDLVLGHDAVRGQRELDEVSRAPGVSMQ